MDIAVTFEEAVTKSRSFWVQFATAHPDLDEASVPKSKMEAASWAACQRVLCFDIDGYDLFGQEFNIFLSNRNQESTKEYCCRKSGGWHGCAAKYCRIRRVGLRSFFLGLCIRLHPNQQQDHIQVHYFGT